jgi:hypothetical protein
VHRTTSSKGEVGFTILLNAASLPYGIPAMVLLETTAALDSEQPQCLVDLKSSHPTVIRAFVSIRSNVSAWEAQFDFTGNPPIARPWDEEYSQYAKVVSEALAALTISVRSID